MYTKVKLLGRFTADLPSQVKVRGDLVDWSLAEQHSMREAVLRPSDALRKKQMPAIHLFELFDGHAEFGTWLATHPKQVGKRDAADAELSLEDPSIASTTASGSAPSTGAATLAPPIADGAGIGAGSASKSKRPVMSISMQAVKSQIKRIKTRG